MNSLISEMPGPAVDVNERAPAHPAPITMPAAASSSSAWISAYLRSLRLGSTRKRSQYSLNASISDVDGVIGYHAPTVAPAYTAPSARGGVAVEENAVLRRVHPLEMEGQGTVVVRLRVVVAEPDRAEVRVEQRALLRELLAQHLADDVHVDLEQRGQRADVDDVAQQRAIAVALERSRRTSCRTECRGS